MKIIIYVRVSKLQQDYQRQINDLTDYANRHQLDIIEIITEKASGFKKKVAERESIKKLMDSIHRQKIDKVLVSEISRLGRNTKEILTILEELMDNNVSLLVLNPQIETLQPNGQKNPVAQLILTIMADLGRMESENLSYRIRSGMMAAKKQGKHIGRPCVNADIANTKNFAKIKKSLKQGLSIRQVAKICEVSTPTVQKVKNFFQA